MKFFNQYRRYVLMDSAGDGTGGGGDGGAPSLLDNPGSGGDPAGGGGSDDPPGGGTGGKGDPPSDKPTKGGSPADWRSSLPKELQDDATIKKFPSVDALAGAYLNAQKLIGADKIAVPNPKTATPEDWENVFNKLGRPALEKYEVKFKDGESVDKDFAEAFRASAHKAGLLPSQAQALADWFSGRRTEAEQKYIETQKNELKAQVENLKKDWGNTFDARIGRVNKMLQEAGATDYFKKAGYGSDATLYRYLDTFAEKLYKDHKLVDGASGKTVRTKDEVQAAISKMHADPAYTNKNHPAHNAAVKEMQSLFQELHPPVDKK